MAWTDGRDISFPFFFFPTSILSFCHLYMLYCYGGFGSGQHHCIISMALGQGLLFGFCFGVSRGETGTGERGRRAVSFLHFLVYTIPDHLWFWIPVFHLYPVFTFTLSCFGGLFLHFPQAAWPCFIVDVIVVRLVGRLGSPRPSGNDTHVLGPFGSRPVTILKARIPFRKAVSSTAPGPGRATIQTLGW